MGLPAVTGAESINRVVASVGDAAITQHDVNQEYAFEQFLNGQMPQGSPSAAQQQMLLNRLISRELLREQLSASELASADSHRAAQKMLASIHKKFANETSYRQALDSLGLTEDQALSRLEDYQRTLQMIDQRLRPMAQPEPEQIESYYKQTFVPEFAKEHKGGSPPPIGEVRDQIEEILVQKKINQMLGQWLKRLQASHHVVIHDM